ncbi:MAG: bifunctional oligoribonuclease/PAP phosphatase NrnA [Phascolarctobacterium sp.]|nr:bifunctional oligoribonuclease/PAP phosphatase NrnA [Phascolarctobacterium sp.]
MAANKIALVCHVSPDSDTLGSALGLMLKLEQLGKKTVILVDDYIGTEFKFLPCIERCIRPQASENIYADILAVIDSSTFDRIGLAGKVVKAPIILNIDHHISNAKFADYLYLDTEAAATGEIMCDLFEVMKWKYDLETATCFYAAISTDCGFFKYSNTKSKTMMRAAELLSAGVRPNEISDAIDMKSRNTIELLAKVLATLSFEYSGRVAYVTISNDLYDKSIPTDSFVSYPRYIEGVEIAVMFKAVEQEVTRVSLRSSNVDVSEIATKFGGGGHLRAAGCTINAPIEEAKQQLFTILKEIL